MTLILAGDIGGTKTILQLVEVSSKYELNPIAEKKYCSGNFPDLVPMVKDFFASNNTRNIYRACFGVAGPVVDGTVKLTNIDWFLDSKRLQIELGISQVSLINDFTAVGYGILGLNSTDLCTLQPGKPNSKAPIAIIGAGTGLGQGFLIEQGGRYQIFASEGGHADFAPRRELEFRLLKYLLDKYHIQRVSVERVVSGLGLIAIYQFIRDCQLTSESPEIAQVVRTWEQEAGKQEKSVDPGAAIGKAAVQGIDYLAEATMKLFVEIYGAEAGNLALKLLPYGGLYVVGGIAPKILPLLESGCFLFNFTHKGRMQGILENIPVHIVLNPQVGLVGAAICAAGL
ncbi:Glucokinase [Richelia intracellularis HH01]|uniref:Glucokinase n=1 Tax=Richelia intracellularis HH01 TaxID=1165094 RepID=M1WQE0_9NOST|nr:glucokinase [Richelia intracellularis]CCH66334.1 Glucokinase [Richelia intracellularis HH01]HAE06608.1 glucokinase [Richelia sp.]